MASSSSSLTYAFQFSSVPLTTTTTTTTTTLPSTTCSNFSICKPLTTIRRHMIPKATATVPSRPLLTNNNKTSSRSIDTTTRTTTRQHTIDEQLLAYESFLHSCTDSEQEEFNQNPVYKHGDGGLVCEWNSHIAHVQRQRQNDKLVAQYQSFLESPDAHDIDRNKPVYITHSGCLVCQYP